MKTFLRVLLVITLLDSWAQDSSKVMRLKDFMELVCQNHPIMRQSDFMGRAAQYEIGMARGNFDPKYDFDFTRKNFKGTTYYDYLDHGLKIPTWIGADVKAGFEKNSGLFVNPTNYTPPGGLMYLGIDIPIGKGMWMDERRAMVRQAQAAAQMTEGEQRKLQLKLYSSAIKDYFDWVFLEERNALLKESVKLSEIRLAGIKERVMQGDLPSIDSIEAATQYNDRMNELLVNENNLFIQRNRIETYFWSPDGVPLEMSENLKPSLEENYFVIPQKQPLQDSIATFHPELIKLRAKVTQYKIEQRWRRNDVLPGVVFTAKYLNTPDHPLQNDFTYSYIQNNYKLQVALVQPLFIRKELNKMRLSTVKLSMAQNDERLANREALNDLDNSFQSIQTWKSYKERQTANASLYKQLMEGEQIRFQNGESTVFLVNSRENKWLEGTMKELEAKLKYEKSAMEIYLSAGQFPKMNP